MDEKFENVVEETNENIDAQTTEENEEGIELTDTTNTDESNNNEPVEEKEEEKPQGRYVTDEELNSIVDKRVARKMSKLEREYESKYVDYRDTEAVLNAGLGTSNIKEANEKMREYYQNEGIKMPDKVVPGYSEREIRILAEAEANEFIEDGYDSMLNEANRLAAIGYANMNEREKIIFTKLGDELTKVNEKEELKKIGANEELLKEENFISFRKKFNSNVSIKDVYELYKEKQPKPKVETPGSMKSRNDSSKVKSFYTREEALRFTKEDLDKSPELVKAIENSMTKW